MERFLCFLLSLHIIYDVSTARSDHIRILVHSACIGSGSTYVYGYCDATYQEGWNAAQTLEFVKNSKLLRLLSKSSTKKRIPARHDRSLLSTHLLLHRNEADHNIALSLAMSRDGSSGGCIRMCVITKEKVERHFIPGNELPRFWEGKEVLGGGSKVGVLA